jgi:hypothetical protein
LELEDSMGICGWHFTIPVMTNVDDVGYGMVFQTLLWSPFDFDKT